jgi:membrane protease YdiL (CAAX protease family)
MEDCSKIKGFRMASVILVKKTHMNNEPLNKIKINFIGGTILLTVFWLLGFLVFGIVAMVLGAENEVALLTASQIAVWLLPALLFATCFYHNFWADLNVKKFGKRTDYGWFILLYLITLPLVGYFAQISELFPFPESWIEFSRNVETQTKELILQFVSGKTTKGLISALLVMAVLPAICEEVLFRGVILNNLVKRNVGVHVAVWISAILFSAVHLEVLGFVSRTLMGATFGYAFVYSKSLWLPIILHFINNAILVFAYFFSTETMLSDDTFIVPHWAAVLSVMTIAIVFLKIQKSKLATKIKAEFTEVNEHFIEGA